jgi:hypothetical protein
VATASWNSTHLVSHRASTTSTGRYRQGWDIVTENSSSGVNLRNCAHAFWDATAINSVLDGMIIDSVKLKVQSTTNYGLSNEISFYFFQSPYKYSSGNSSHLDPNDSTPQSEFIDADGDPISGYIASPTIPRSSSTAYTTTLTTDFLTNIRNGYGIASYRKTTPAYPTTSHYTRETTDPLVLIVTYHAPASTFTLDKTSVAADQPITATITATNSAYSHRVTWYLNNTYKQVMSIPSGSITFPLTFTPQPSWCEALPTTTSATCKCTVETLNGSTVLGSAEKTFTFIVPASYIPTINGATANPVSQYWDLYVQGKSKVTLGVSGASFTGTHGASAKKYIFKLGTTLLAEQDSTSYTTGYLSTSGGIYQSSGTYAGTYKLTYSVQVKDTRDRVSTAQTVDVYVTPYSSPVITGYSAIRTDNTGAPATEGTCAKCVMTYTWSSIGSNTRTTQVHYRPSGSTGPYTDGDISLIESGGNWIIGSNSLSANTSYEIRFKIYDYFTSSSPTYAYYTLQTANYTLHCKAGGLGIAIGKASTIDNALEINPTWALYANGTRIATPINPNLLINAEYFPVWQRGTSFGAIGYTADRWYGNATSGTTIQKSTLGGTSALRIIPTQTWRNIKQYIEYPSRLSGKTVTLSCNYYGADCYVSVQVNGTDTISSTGSTGSATNTLAVTGTLPTITDSDSVAVLFGMKTNYTSNTITVGYIKLEIGAVATPPSPLSYGEEVSMCQRYLLPLGYTRLRADRRTNDLIDFVIPLTTTMRGTPSPTIIGTPVVYAFGGAAQTGFSFATSVISSSTVTIRATKTAHGLTDATLDLDYNCFLDNEIYP